MNIFHLHNRSVVHFFLFGSFSTSGFTFWPAKLMSIDGQMVNVRFFGDHTHADVPATNCFLYSGHNPDKRRSATTAYNSAIKVKN